MIFRLLDPDQGEVLIDNQSLRDVTLQSLRSKISIVPQNGILFNDSILFNLQYGNPNATLEEI